MMDHRQKEKFFVIVSPGLEKVCSEELSALGILPLEITTAGVVFAGGLRDLYLANLWLRTASRVVVRFAEFRCRDFPDLHQRARRLPWGRFVRPDTPVSFRVTCRASRLNHTVRIAETLVSAVNQALGRTTNPAAEASQLVLVRIVDDQVVLSIDSSGDLLHRRGYRQSTTAAPLRETLAAGVLMLLEWHATEPLADPMCGSGSFLIEGALLARRQAPGLNRPFAFMNWPGYRQGLWKLLCEEARRGVLETDIPIFGADENPGAIAAAQENCQRSGTGGQVFVDLLSLSEQPVHKGPGLVVCNPPYGKRLAFGKNPEACYAELGKHLLRAYPGWTLAMICPEHDLLKATSLPFRQIARLDNGGLLVGLFVAKSG